MFGFESTTQFVVTIAVAIFFGFLINYLLADKFTSPCKTCEQTKRTLQEQHELQRKKIETMEKDDIFEELMN